MTLPGTGWPSAAAARSWLKAERARLGWDAKRLSQEFDRTAGVSDLYIGPGGGALFARPTIRRIELFEQGGEVIPVWLYWIPLAIKRAAAAAAASEPMEMFIWERKNIPEHRSIREDRLDAEC